jgi:hypothetical protein
MKNKLFSLRKTAMRLRSQWPLDVQGDAGHPAINRKKCSTKEEERHKEFLTPTHSSPNLVLEPRVEVNDVAELVADLRDGRRVQGVGLDRR